MALLSDHGAIFPSHLPVMVGHGPRMAVPAFDEGTTRWLLVPTKITMEEQAGEILVADMRTQQL